MSLKRLILHGENLQRRFFEKPTEGSKQEIILFVDRSLDVEIDDMEESGYAHHCFRVLAVYTEVHRRMFGITPSLGEAVGAYLHDIGKLFHPELFESDHVFSPDDWELCKQHTVDGNVFLMKNFKNPVVGDMALYHHERSDGSGYPTKRHTLSLPAQLLATVDPLVSILENRNYRVRKDPLIEWFAMKDILYAPYVDHTIEYLKERFYDRELYSYQ